MALGIPASAIGLIVSGDVDGITIYTDRHGRKIAYPKAPPKEPPSDAQVALRARFKAAQAQYMSWRQPKRDAWEDLARAANLCLTGQNLLIHVAMKHTYEFLETIMRQTGIRVYPPDPV